MKLDSSSFQDIQLICKACNAKFYFTAGEQAFYTAKGFEDQPKSCKDCRLAAKAEKDAGNVYRGSPVATDGLPGWTLTVCLMIGQTHLNSDAVLG